MKKKLTIFLILNLLILPVKSFEQYYKPFCIVTGSVLTLCVIKLIIENRKLKKRLRDAWVITCTMKDVETQIESE